jgi:cholestenol delta-isomerase
MSTVSHPYYPLGVHIPEYFPNESSVPSLIGQFAFLWGAVISVAWLIINRVRPRASKSDRLAFLWFCFSRYSTRSSIRPGLNLRSTAASMHLFFEGYFVLHHATIAGKSDLFGELWKEYSLSDSRYLRSDAFLVCMEVVTAVGASSSCSYIRSVSKLIQFRRQQFCWGPLSFLAAACIAAQHSMRHALQIIISLGQIYGDALYYAMSLFDLYYHGTHFCRPEGYYFWMY